MDLSRFILPLVGASVGPGLAPLKAFQTLKLGNIVLTTLPEKKEEALAVMRHCRENRIHVMLGEIIHRGNRSRWHNHSLSKRDLEEIASEGGEYFLGRYAVGEAGGMLYWPKSYTIGERAGAYRNLPPCANEAEAREKYVGCLRSELEYERNVICDVPLFNVESSIAFSCHSEAGIDGQCIEMLPGDPILTLSAVRGAARARHTVWGAHIAMLWYGGIRLDELWLKRWRAALWTAFLAGAEFIYPESGHLEYHARDEKWFEFDSPEMLRTRRELRALHRFAQIHERPAGGPESPAAVVRGKDDGHPGIWNPYAWGQYENGAEWESSDAEKGWALFDTVFTREPFFHENVTGCRDWSGNPPSGQLDVIPPDADFSAFGTLLFIGYNRMDDTLYGKLTDFVKNGGHLVIWLSHFDNAEKRGDEVKLFRGGDLSALCGLKVAGRLPGDVRGMKYVAKSSFGEYDFPVRSANRDPYFIGRSDEAEVELTDPEARVLAGYSDYVRDTVEGVSKHPLLVERRLGKGVVFTVAAFSKPGADGMRKFAENLVRTVLKARRGEFEFITPDTVRWAVYPSGGAKIVYLLNTDPDIAEGVGFVRKGRRVPGPILLEPGEFRVLYIADDLLFLPSDPLGGLENAGGGSYSFLLDRQEFEVRELSGAARRISVNGIPLELAPCGTARFSCPANIPPEKAAFFDPAYLDEPPIEMAERSTPY